MPQCVGYNLPMARGDNAREGDSHVKTALNVLDRAALIGDHMFIMGI